LTTRDVKPGEAGWMTAWREARTDGRDDEGCISDRTSRWKTRKRPREEEGRGEREGTSADVQDLLREAADSQSIVCWAVPGHPIALLKLYSSLI
jgi:hypothetical protein